MFLIHASACIGQVWCIGSCCLHLTNDKGYTMKYIRTSLCLVFALVATHVCFFQLHASEACKEEVKKKCLKKAKNECKKQEIIPVAECESNAQKLCSKKAKASCAS
jgi:hypothetical protein